MKCFMKRVPNILTKWCLNKFLKFIITILDAQMTLKMLLVGPQNVNCRTSYYKKSFLPSIVSLWNTIPQCVRSNYSKYFLYGSYSRKRQILHARLRMRNNSLNDLLFHCNLSNTKLCEQYRSTIHLLFVGVLCGGAGSDRVRRRDRKLYHRI